MAPFGALSPAHAPSLPPFSFSLCTFQKSVLWVTQVILCLAGEGTMQRLRLY